MGGNVMATIEPIQPIVTIAMTVRLPWAAAIRSATTPTSGKLVENRAKGIPERYIGRRIGIHAAVAWSKEGAADPRIGEWWWGPAWRHRRLLDATDFTEMFRKVIAVARVAGCHRAAQLPAGTCCEPWGDRNYIDPAKVAWHIVLADMVPLADPVGPVRGSLNVPWELPPDVAAIVSDRYLDAP